MRMTSAPMSDSNIAANGPGPIPANSTTRIPCKGPMQTLIAIVPQFPLSWPKGARQHEGQSMRRLIFAAAVFALGAATATGVQSAPQSVYRVDTVTAKVLNNHLVVTASGAVNSGGWSRPRLHLETVHVPESPEEVIEFQAT